MVVAEKIRRAAEDLVVEGENIRFTASFGVFSAIPFGSLSCEDFNKRADDGLYAAKKKREEQGLRRASRVADPGRLILPLPGHGRIRPFDAA